MKYLVLPLLLALACGTGCNRSVPPPTPLTAEELPTVMQQAFNEASSDVKQVAEQVIAAVQAQDYSKAFTGLQNLSALPGLTKEQSTVASRATLTVNSLLQAAQAKGDQKAAQTINTYRKDK